MRREIQLFFEKNSAWNRIQETAKKELSYGEWLNYSHERRRGKKKWEVTTTISRDLTKLLRLTAVGNPAPHCFRVCRSCWNMSRAGSWKDRLQDWLRFFTDRAPHVGTHIPPKANPMGNRQNKKRKKEASKKKHHTKCRAEMIKRKKKGQLLLAMLCQLPILLLFKRRIELGDTLPHATRGTSTK